MRATVDLGKTVRSGFALVLWNQDLSNERGRWRGKRCEVIRNPEVAEGKGYEWISDTKPINHEKRDGRYTYYPALRLKLAPMMWSSRCVELFESVLASSSWASLKTAATSAMESPFSGDGQFPIGDTLVTSQMSRDIVARHWPSPTTTAIHL